MKIIFILSVAVLFWENLAITNAKFKEKDVEEHFQTKREIDYSEIQMDLRSSLKSLQNKILRSMHQATKIKTAEIIKLAKSTKKNIKAVVTQSENNYFGFGKLSGNELQDLQDKMSEAKIITSQGAKDFLALITTSVDELKNLLETTGENVKELTENHTEALKKYKDESAAKVQDLVSTTDIVKGQAEAKSAIEQLNQISFASYAAITKMWETSSVNVLKVENTRSNEVFKLKESIHSKYDAISTSNKLLKNYINSMNDRIDALAQSLSQKFKEMLTNCLGMIEKMVQKHGESIRDLGKQYGNLLQNIADNDEEGKKKTEIITRMLEGNFIKSNKFLFEKFLRDINTETNTIWDEVNHNTEAIKKCSHLKPCNEIER